MADRTLEDAITAAAHGAWAPGVMAARPQVDAMLERIFRSAKWPESAAGSFWPKTSIQGRVGTDPTVAGIPRSIPWLQAFQPGDIIGVY